MRYFILCLIFVQLPAFAEMDVYSRQGLQKTQEFLTNKEQRDAYVKKHPKAADVDKKVSALAGDPQTEEQIYQLASKVMANLAEKTNGDPAKMKQLLKQAQKDPQAFYKNVMNDEERQDVHHIATQIGQHQTAAPSGD